ncbi:MAG: HlyD family efflux transporter periplasmic adaptor subunit [Clostridia bacterium]|nr:HlyD family efflux transporter periplasmic adaptor subunit [Clostridia bacterium]
MKRRGIAVILTITFCAVAFYSYRYLKIPVETEAANMIRREDTISGEAFIARTEAVYTSSDNGVLYSYVDEGARVGKDRIIATVYQGDKNGEIIQELNNIDKKLDQLEGIQKKKETFTTDSTSSETVIERIKSDIINAALTNDVSQIPEYKMTINSMYNTESDENAVTVQELKTQKQTLEASLGSSKSDIYSTISGVYSENVDGLEEILTVDNIMNFTTSEFDGLKKARQNQKTNREVASGEQICKVVDNHMWYAVVKIKNDDTKLLKKKQTVKLRFESLPGTEVSATVEHISEEEGKNAVAVLKSERFLEGVYGIRSDNIEIILNSYTGFEVPVYAIRNMDGKQGVLIASGISQIFCECDVVYNNNENQTVIIYPSDNAVRTLSIGDRIILGEKSKTNENGVVGDGTQEKIEEGTAENASETMEESTAEDEAKNSRETDEDNTENNQ